MRLRVEFVLSLWFFACRFSFGANVTIFKIMYLATAALTHPLLSVIIHLGPFCKFSSVVKIS